MWKSLASKLYRGRGLGKGLPLNETGDVVGGVIRIDETAALLAEPYAILSRSPALVREVFVETRTALRSGGDVCGHAKAYSSAVRPRTTR